MDKGIHTGMILVDLQKKSNKLDHKNLLEKMSCLGFKTSVIKQFELYVTNNKFIVSVGDFFSEAGILNSDVPEEPFWDHSRF